MCTYEIVVHRLAVSTKKQCGFLKIDLRHSIRTLLLHENLHVSTCAWNIDVVVCNDVWMTCKSFVYKCLQY